MAGEVSFIEIGVGDTDAGRKFYEGMFGWKFAEGPGGGGFMIETPNVPAGMHGSDAGADPIIFFAVDDINGAEAKIKELGGEVLDVNVEGDEESVAAFGSFRMCKDDQGSPFGIHQKPADS